MPTTVAIVKRLAAFVIPCIRVFVRTIKPKRLKQKITKLGTGIVHHESSPSIDIKSKNQRSRSQGHKVLKDDRVAGVSYALYQVSTY